MEKVYESKEDYLKNKKFWTDDKGKKISTKNLKEKDVTGLTNTVYKPSTKKQYKIAFDFGGNDVIEYCFYGTYKGAEREATELAKMFVDNPNYRVIIN